MVGYSTAMNHKLQKHNPLYILSETGGQPGEDCVMTSVFEGLICCTQLAVC